MIATHGIQGNVHRRLLLDFGVQDVNDPTFVFATAAAQAMRLLRLAAVLTEIQSRFVEGIMGTTLMGPRM
jgi:hypothetical protein